MEEVYQNEEADVVDQQYMDVAITSTALFNGILRDFARGQVAVAGGPYCGRCERGNVTCGTVGDAI